MKGGDAYKPFQAESRGGSPLPGQLKALETISGLVDKLGDTDEISPASTTVLKFSLQELADIYIKEGKG